MEMKDVPAIVKLLRLIRANIIFIGVCTAVVTVLSAVYIVSIPRGYKSEVILLPEISNGMGGFSGSLSSLASLAGIKLGSTTEDAIYPEFYPKVLSSSVFIVRMFNEKIHVERLNKDVTIYEYFNDYQKKPWWRFGAVPSDKDNNSKANPQRLTKGQKRIAKAFTESFLCMVDKKTDMITIAVEVQDADVAAQIADLICSRLQFYITEYRTSKSRKDLEYVQKITDEVKQKYLKAQEKYANFSDTNEGLILYSYRQVRDRLENEMELAYNMYSQSMQQLQLAQAKVQERTPAFTVIQPAMVPLKPSSPKRVVTVFIMCVLSFSCSVLWLLCKDYYNRLRL